MSKFCSVSGEMQAQFLKEGISPSKLKYIESIIPFDGPDCSCSSDIAKMYSDVATGKKPYRVECSHPKKGLKQYDISCKECGSIVGKCYAKNKSLDDIHDLRYICYTDGIKWYGAMALNISPIDGKLGFECSCGADTRDFRLNNTLPPKLLDEKLSNLTSRDFGTKNSKFEAKEIKSVS